MLLLRKGSMAVPMTSRMAFYEVVCLPFFAATIWMQQMSVHRQGCDCHEHYDNGSESNALCVGVKEHLTPVPWAFCERHSTTQRNNAPKKFGVAI